MIKDELSSGMVVETRNGGRYVVVKGVSYRSAHDGIVFLGKTEWLNADNFTDDLINTSFSSFDIVKVFARSLDADYDIVAIDKRMPLEFNKSLDDDVVNNL